MTESASWNFTEAVCRAWTADNKCDFDLIRKIWKCEEEVLKSKQSQRHQQRCKHAVAFQKNNQGMAGWRNRGGAYSADLRAGGPQRNHTAAERHRRSTRTTVPPAQENHWSTPRSQSSRCEPLTSAVSSGKGRVDLIPLETHRKTDRRKTRVFTAGGQQRHSGLSPQPSSLEER